MGLFRTKKWKKIQNVFAWYEVMIEFDLDELGIDKDNIRKLFLDDGWLVIRYKNGTHERIEPKVTIEFDCPMDITYTDENDDRVWEYEL